MTSYHRSAAARRRRTVLQLSVIAAITALAVVVGVHVAGATSTGKRAAAAGERSGPDQSAAAADLTTKLAKIIPSGIAASVAAFEPSSGDRLDFGQTSGMLDASISKLDILECVLLTHEDAKLPIDADTDSLATSMIENSDNDAGQSLWDSLGPVQTITSLNTRLGLTHTLPNPDGYYGLSTTGAADQIALLDDLVRADGPLDAPSQAYALNLLHNVEADQRWGTPAAADPGTTSAVKNGWLAVDADNDRWEVNSDGVLTVDGHQLLISVLTAHDSDEQSGINLVESISKAVATSLT